MEDTTLKKKDIEELEKLVKIAEEQGNNINLNLVYMIIDSEKINFAEVMNQILRHIHVKVNGLDLLILLK